MFKFFERTPVLWIGMFILGFSINISSAQQKKSNPKYADIDTLIAHIPKLMHSDIKAAKTTIDKVNELSKANSYQHGIIEGAFGRCWYLYHIGKIDESASMLDSCIKHFSHSTTESFPTKFNILLGQCFVKKEKFDLAVQQFSIVLKTAEKDHDDAGRAGALVSIGWAYMEDNKPKDAIEFFKEVLKIKSADEYTNPATVLNNIAACDNSLSNYKEAETYARRGVDASRKMNSNIDLANGLNILAGAIYQQGNTKEALTYLSEASKVRETVGDPAMLASDYMELSDIYRKSHQFGPAIDYAEKAVALSIKNNIPIKIESAYGTLANSLEEAGNYKQAAVYYKKLLNFKDSTNNSANNKAMADMLVKYNTQKKTNENLQLKQDNLNTRFKTTLISSIAVLIALVSAFLYLNIRNRYKTKLALQQVEEQKNKVLTVLETEEKERNRIAADLHDGVCQMLAAVSLQLQNPKQSIVVAQDLLEKATAEVRSVSHQMTPELLKHYGLVKAIESDVQRLNNLNTGTHFNFFEHIEQHHEDELLQVMIYRAFQELVNNINRHAKANEININLTLTKETVILLVEDNGIGFNAQDTPLGLGLKSLANRVKVFNGKLVVDSTIGKGTTVIIQFGETILT